MFDLTKQLELPKGLQKKYQIARAILHLAFLFAVGTVAYLILFPIIPLDFSLDNPTSNKNNLVSPRVASTGEFPTNGKIAKGDTLIDNANPIGQFSKADITLTLGKNSTKIDDVPVKIDKSYQAFRYPVGDPAGFKDGTLMTTPDGAYYIVSDSTLRKFADTDIILQLGYPKSAFISVQKSDLRYNRPGDDIINADSYPNNSLFVIDEAYYELKEGRLFPFVSAHAFLSQFEPNNAIAKNSDFLSSHPVSEKISGFASGTLASFDVSVYILSEDKNYPVMNPETFVAMGYNWDDIIPISQDELSIYEKQKQFTHDDPHPNGTIFLSQKTNEYFIIENGLKRPIKSEAIVKTYAKQKPVIADLQDLEKNSTCILKKSSVNENILGCSVSLDASIGSVGNDYQIAMTTPADINLNAINVTFSTPVTWNNIRISLGRIKQRIIARQL